jgi:hypothetical protein
MYFLKKYVKSSFDFERSVSMALYTCANQKLKGIINTWPLMIMKVLHRPRNSRGDESILSLDWSLRTGA